MNNKLATEIRDYGMNRVFDGMDFSELIRIDSGKFVFPTSAKWILWRKRKIIRLITTLRNTLKNLKRLMPEKRKNGVNSPKSPTRLKLNSVL